MLGPYTLKTIDELPYGVFPEYPTGPAIVSHAGWNTGSSHCPMEWEGHKLSVFKVISERPYVAEYHELHDQIFPTREEATKAKYDAGLIAYMVYDDSEWAKMCEICYRIPCNCDWHKSDTIPDVDLGRH